MVGREFFTFCVCVEFYQLKILNTIQKHKKKTHLRRRNIYLIINFRAVEVRV